MSTMNAVLAPTLYGNDPWSPREQSCPPRYVQLGLSSRTDLWNTLPTTDRAWSIPAPTMITETAASEPPSLVFFFDDWEDDVSLLSDNPDDDDVQVLPHATYNVLAPLFDEIYEGEDTSKEDDARAARK